MPDDATAKPGSRWKKQLSNQIAAEVLKQRRAILTNRKDSTERGGIATHVSLEDRKLHNATPRRVIGAATSRPVAKHLVTRSSLGQRVAASELLAIALMIKVITRERS